MVRASFFGVSTCILRATPRTSPAAPENRSRRNRRTVTATRVGGSAKRRHVRITRLRNTILADRTEIFWLLPAIAQCRWRYRAGRVVAASKRHRRLRNSSIPGKRPRPVFGSHKCAPAAFGQGRRPRGAWRATLCKCYAARSARAATPLLQTAPCRATPGCIKVIGAGHTIAAQRQRKMCRVPPPKLALW